MSFVFSSAFVVCLYFPEAELKETRKRAKTSEAHAPNSQHNVQHGSHTHPQTIKTRALSSTTQNVPTSKLPDQIQLKHVRNLKPGPLIGLSKAISTDSAKPYQ
jgi:hypothetical protein